RASHPPWRPGARPALCQCQREERAPLAGVGSEGPALHGSCPSASAGRVLSRSPAGSGRGRVLFPVEKGRPVMRAMVLERPRAPLIMRERPTPAPAAGDILDEIATWGVCRTDLHVVDGELPNPKLPLVPGHEIVGRVAALGAGVAGFAIGERIGVPWLAYTCGVCSYCRTGHENLCDRPLFTGYTRDG